MGTIGARTVVAVFESMPAAEGAKTTLIRAGVPEQRIALSAGLTDDGIAAEVPGQSYENQPGQPARSAGEIEYVTQLLRRQNGYRMGARG